MPLYLSSSALYGRNKAIAKLSHACVQINPSKPVWILIEGAAGIGKTSLVKFVRKTLQLSPTQYGAGKFDQFHRQTPYSALITALRMLIKTTAALPAAERTAWQAASHPPSGNPFAPLVGVLPELVSLIGPTALPAPVAPRDAQVRMETAFAYLIRFFARAEHPLLLFLDDLQWADIATLRLLRSLGTESELGHLMILGTYRDNEVTSLHPLTQTLATLEERRTSVTRIQLGALSSKDVEEWLVDTYGIAATDAPSAAQWLTQQSEGNPLFIRQLLSTLRKRGVLRQHPDDQQWHWEAAQLEGEQHAGNITTFMEGRLRELPEAQQALLSHAACIGTQFLVGELAGIMDESPQHVCLLLKQVQEAQLVELEQADSWRFVHDRVQQAAYRHLPDVNRTAQHLRIGRAFLAATPDDALDARCFELVAQFNHATHLLTPQEHLTTADLNLRAGRRAKSSAAFEAALGYLTTGYQLLQESAWETHYDLAFGLVRESAECAYASGDVAEADRWFALALQRAHSRLDRAHIYGIMIMFCLNAGRARDAWQLGAACLSTFDIEFDSDPVVLEEAINRDEPAILAQLSATTLEELMRENMSLTDEQNTVADILLRLHAAGYQLGKHTYAYLTLRMLEFGLQTRHRSVLAMGLMNFAVTFTARHGTYAEADHHARWSLEIAKHLPDATIRARIDYIYGAMVAHWTKPIAIGLQALERCYEQSQATADKVYIGLALSFEFRAHMLAGDTVSSLVKKWESTAPIIEHINSAPISVVYAINRQWLRAWKEETRSATELDSDDVDTATLQRQLDVLPAKSPYHWFHLLQAILAYVHGQPGKALTHITQADVYLDAVAGQLAIPAHHFWRGLILHANGESGALLSSVTLMNGWRTNCAENFGHYASLLQAELYRSQGEVESALAAYHDAIGCARDSHHLLLLGLALERLSDFHREQSLPYQARACLQESAATYRSWGAASKVRELRTRYPDETVETCTTTQHDHAVPLTSASTLAALSEIRLDRLLGRLLPLLATVCETSRVVAVVAREGQLMVEAQHPAPKAKLEQPLPVALTRASAYPGTLIAASCAQGQPLLVAAPHTHPDYAAQPCWTTHPAAASLCLPVMRHGRLLGAFYLERQQGNWANNILAELEPLLIHVATALENALLYVDFEQQIAERARAEKIAREGERRWRGFLDHAHMAVLSLDLAGHIQYINPYLQKLSGHTEEAVIGKEWTKILLPPEYKTQDLHGILLKQISEQGHFNGLTKIRMQNGEDRVFSWSNSLLRDPDGRPVGSISIGSDMTDQRRAERALLQLNAELEARVVQRTSELAAANRELDSFAYSISHDLRAPLRSIDGFSLALWEDYQAALDDTAQDYIKRVRAAARRMGEMIDAVLQMSRQTRGDMVLDLVDVTAMAGEVIEELRARDPNRQANITLQPMMEVRAASRLLRILLENLLGNAWKYTVNTPHTEIRLSVTHQDEEQIFCVSDNGPGFNMAQAGKLFAAFQRLHSGDNIEGHGIGLATVQRIVHRHGGRIWAEAQPGLGASFFFTLCAPDSVIKE